MYPFRHLHRPPNIYRTFRCTRLRLNRRLRARHCRRSRGQSPRCRLRRRPWFPTGNRAPLTQLVGRAGLIPDVNRRDIATVTRLADGLRDCARDVVADFAERDADAVDNLYKWVSICKRVRCKGKKPTIEHMARNQMITVIFSLSAAASSRISPLTVIFSRNSRPT